MQHHHDILRAGFATRTINPALGVPLVGYPKPRANTGVDIDLHARAAVFASSTKGSAPAAALLVLDTLGVSAKLVERMRTLAAERVPGLTPDSLMIVATHTHSAPSLDPTGTGDGQFPADSPYVEQAIAASLDALEEAWKSARNVRVRVGHSELRLGHNRRVVDAEGRAKNEWLDPDAQHTGLFNPNVRILSFEDAGTANPVGLIALYGCHPVTLGPGNTKASADYAGYLVANLEEALPGCLAIHLTGACAEINPRNALADEPVFAKSAGEALATAILDELPRARPVMAVPLAARIEPLGLPLGPEATPSRVERARSSADGKTVESELQVIRIGPVALISAPGELFCALGIAIENASPAQTTFVVGYANDDLGYLCTDAARREGAYEPTKQVSHHVERVLLPTARKALDAVFRAG